MQLEFALPKDKEAVIALYNLCFPGEQDYCAWWHDHFWKPEHCLVVREGGEILSMVNLMEVSMRWNDDLLDCTYIYAAATHPDHRGKGLMKTMLEFSFGMGEAEGKDLSVLITENDSLFAFYARFGYQPAFGVSTVPMSEEPPLPMCKARMLRREDAAMLADFYKNCTRERVAVERTAARFEEILEEYNEHAFGLFDQSGENLLAYCLMDSDGIHAAEVIGIGGGYLLYVCSMQPEQAIGRSLPMGEDDKPVGCALALSERGKAALEQAVYRPYLNILFN